VVEHGAEGKQTIMNRATRMAFPAAAALAMAMAGAHTDDPDFATVLRRAGEYASDYHVKLSVMIAEEHYVQRTGPDLSSPASTLGRPIVEHERVLRSDFAIVRGFAGGSPWIGVRDVLEVDGVPVEGESSRLQSLLSDTRTPLSDRVRTLADQQAKYNLGEIYRTINVPTLALDFLLPDQQPRFRYRRSGDAVVGGRPVWKITFKERERPTLIRTPGGADVLSTGAFWIDPQTGAALRSELHAGENLRRGFRTIIVVSYAHDARFDMLLPEDMDELYAAGRNRIEGHATYSNFRRFETGVRIK
jgi:hypothetical protein